MDSGCCAAHRVGSYRPEPLTSPSTGRFIDLRRFNFEIVEVRSASWDPAYRISADGQMTLNLLREFVQRQREGIRGAVAVRYFPRGLVLAGDIMLDEIGVVESRRVFLPSAELELIKPAPGPHNNPVRIFCATRLTWKLP